MIRQRFYIGRRDWEIELFYDIVGERDLEVIYPFLLRYGSDDSEAMRTCMILSKKNTGCTLTNFRKKKSLVLISEAENNEQIYDTIQHELKHVTEHISEYYGVEPTSEESAYLQGEIARKMYEAIPLLICPKCGCRINK